MGAVAAEYSLISDHCLSKIEETEKFGHNFYILLYFVKFFILRKTKKRLNFVKFFLAFLAYISSKKRHIHHELD